MYDMSYAKDVLGNPDVAPSGIYKYFDMFTWGGWWSWFMDVFTTFDPLTTLVKVIGLTIDWWFMDLYDSMGADKWNPNYPENSKAVVFDKNLWTNKAWN
jgi:hypothetical protein